MEFQSNLFKLFAMLRRVRKGGGEEELEQMGESGGLNIVNLLDIFIILVIFLLKGYSASVESKITISKDMKLPTSTTQKDVKDFVNITVTKNAIMVEGTPVAKITDSKIEGVPDNKLLIPTLYDALEKEKKKIETIAKYNPNVQFKGEINLIAHKEIPFSIIKKILYTAGQVGFGEFKFVVIKEEAK